MRPLFSGSLRAKLAAVIVVTTLVALVVALCAMITYDLTLFRSKSVAELQTQAELLGRTIAPALQFDDPKVARENLQLLRFRPEIEAAAIYDADGNVFARYSSGGGQNLLPRSPDSDGVSVEAPILTAFKRIEDHGQVLGTVYLRARYELYARFRNYAGIAALVALLAMLIAILISTRMQAAVTRPILAIAAIARHIVTTRDYSVRAVRTTNDEVGVLAQAFNDMVGEIQKRAHELQRLNEELEDRVRERTAELQEVNRDLEAFTYSVSHDLRAPLRAMDGFCGIIAEDYADKLNEDVRKLINGVRASSRKMAQLIEDLLLFSRTARQQVRAVPVDMTQLASRAWAEISADAPPGSIRFTLGQLPAAQGDAALLMQVWLNLIGNARKYSAKRPLPIIDISGAVQDGHAVYRVQDNGVGFDMRHYQRLFEVFQRLHPTADFSGSGVGLAIVQRIVARHGGRVWAEGRVDEGATFFISLPAA
jgi:signal transduction histidine kinase